MACARRPDSEFHSASHAGVLAVAAYGMSRRPIYVSDREATPERACDLNIHARWMFAVGIVAAAAVSGGLPTRAHALTQTQSATLAAKARADALARARLQARADALAKANVDAARRSRAVVIARQNVGAETKRRAEAAEKAAQAQAQIQAASTQLLTKPDDRTRFVQAPLQSPRKLQISTVQPLQTPPRPKVAQISRAHSTAGKSSNVTARRSSHAR